MSGVTWMRRCVLIVSVVLLLIVGLVSGGCGGSDPEPGATTTTEASSTVSSSSQPEADGEGALLAEEIMGVFDEMAAEVAELVKEKPEPAVLKPELEALYETYTRKMSDLNVRYLALRESDVVQFGQCNGRVSDLRPVRHTAMQDSIVEAIRHYNFELGDQEIVSLLSQKPTQVLDVAVDQGQ